MIKLAFATLYALLPAFAANMAPVVATRLNFAPRLARPLDGGMKLWGEALFGEGKTWRGFAVGVSAAMFIGIAQYFLWHFNIVRLYSIINYSAVDPVTFGFLGGTGALGGDLIKSFFKRRFHLSSGSPWPVFDQLDFILGYFGATYFFVGWQMPVFLMALALTLVFHPLVNIIAYALSIKKVWW